MVASSVAADLTRSDVERIAALAHVELTEDEKDRIARQLDEILSYAKQVRDIDTTGVTATAQVLERPPAARPDEVQPSLDRDEALASAPDADRAAGLFRVPRVIG